MPPDREPKAARAAASAEPAKRGRLGYRIEYLATRAVVGVVERLPFAVAAALARSFASLMGLAVPKRVRAAREQMGAALGLDPASPQVHAAVREVFRTIAWNSLWLIRLPRAMRKSPPELVLEIEGREHIESAKARGRGIVFATAHLGNFEGLGAIAPALGVPLATVSRPMKNALLQEWTRRRRVTHGQRLIPKDGALIAVARLLREKGNAAFMLDQHAGSDGVRMPFFHADCSTFTTAATLARRFDAAFIPAFATAVGPRATRVVVESPIEPDPSLPADEDAWRMTLEWNRRLEAAIRKAPGQFLWLHRRWKKGGSEPDPAWRERWGAR
jgi:KDO2-lipid IV(A) lauroyltransferase